MQVDFKFFHYSYIKSNQSLWEKGRNYEMLGAANSLWHKDAEHCLEGTEVIKFEGVHPSAMNFYPFYKYKIETEEKNGKLFIKRKDW